MIRNPTFMPLADYRLEQLRGQYLRIIDQAIQSRGIRTRRRCPGMTFEFEGGPCRIWLGYYHDERFWRITCGRGDWYANTGTNYELTMLAEEITPTTGLELLEFLHAPGMYQWPLFCHDQSYPTYAWSKAAQEGINRVYIEKVERRSRTAAF